MGAAGFTTYFFLTLIPGTVSSSRNLCYHRNKQSCSHQHNPRTEEQTEETVRLPLLTVTSLGCCKTFAEPVKD